jgi:hypothetical protein
VLLGELHGDVGARRLARVPEGASLVTLIDGAGSLVAGAPLTDDAPTGVRPDLEAPAPPGSASPGPTAPEPVTAPSPTAAPPAVDAPEPPAPGIPVGLPVLPFLR